MREREKLMGCRATEVSTNQLKAAQRGGKSSMMKCGREGRIEVQPHCHHTNHRERGKLLSPETGFESRLVCRGEQGKARWWGQETGGGQGRHAGGGGKVNCKGLKRKIQEFRNTKNKNVHEKYKNAKRHRMFKNMIHLLLPSQNEIDREGEAACVQEEGEGSRKGMYVGWGSWYGVRCVCGGKGGGVQVWWWCAGEKAVVCVQCGRQVQGVVGREGKKARRYSEGGVKMQQLA